MLSPHRRDERGLTLIEILITLSVAVVITGIAFPALGGVMARASADADARSAAELAAFATRWDTGTTRIGDGTGADAGYLVAFKDSNGNGTQDGGEATLSRIAGALADLTAPVPGGLTVIDVPDAAYSWVVRIAGEVIYVKAHLNSDSGMTNRIYTYNPATAALTEVEHPATTGVAADWKWSTGGPINATWLYYYNYTDPGDPYELHLVNRTTGADLLVGSNVWSSPSVYDVSPDGTKVTYISATSSSEFGAFVYDIAAATSAPITVSGKSILAPYFLSDSQVLFCARPAEETSWGCKDFYVYTIASGASAAATGTWAALTGSPETQLWDATADYVVFTEDLRKTLKVLNRADGTVETVITAVDVNYIPTSTAVIGSQLYFTTGGAHPDNYVYDIAANTLTAITLDAAAAWDYESMYEAGTSYVGGEVANEDWSVDKAFIFPRP